MHQNSIAVPIFSSTHKRPNQSQNNQSNEKLSIFDIQWPLNYHEERIRRLHETLELVLSLLELRRRVQKINIVLENLKHGKKIKINSQTIRNDDQTSNFGDEKRINGIGESEITDSPLLKLLEIEKP